MHIARRQFLTVATAAAGGLAMGITIPAANAAEAAPEVGIWVTIAPDDTITIRIARSEMGQGTLTGLAQLVCDELDGNWAKVKTEYVTPEANLASKRAWGPMSTGGSQGIRGSVVYVRKGGAAARAMLIQAAATQWNAPVGECSASDSVITHSSGKTLRYGEVAEAASKLAVPAEIPVKDPKAWKIIGKGVKRLDTAEKLNGSLVFGIDVAVPGMLNAAIMACPVPGGKLKSFDAAKIKSMAGVRHVVAVGDDAVAVVADKFFQAKPRSPACRSAGMKARTATSTAPTSLNCSKPVCRQPMASAPRRKSATSTRPSPVRPRRSKPITPPHSSITQPWSR